MRWNIYIASACRNVDVCRGEPSGATTLLQPLPHPDSFKQSKRCFAEVSAKSRRIVSSAPPHSLYSLVFYSFSLYFLADISSCISMILSLSAFSSFSTSRDTNRDWAFNNDESAVASRGNNRRA